jgi:hypothetical protein
MEELKQDILIMAWDFFGGLALFLLIMGHDYGWYNGLLYNVVDFFCNYIAIIFASMILLLIGLAIYSERKIYKSKYSYLNKVPTINSKEKYFNNLKDTRKRRSDCLNIEKAKQNGKMQVL